MASYADKALKCIECGNEFTYTAAEQELHASLGYQNEPKRCNPCREAKRQRKGGSAPRAGGAPGNAAPRGGGGDRPPREGNGGGGGGREQREPRNQAPRERREPAGGGGGGGGGGRELFMAICNECGAEAQLPFKPRGDRPIFCSDCFTKKKAASS